MMKQELGRANQLYQQAGVWLVADNPCDHLARWQVDPYTGVMLQVCS